MVNRKKRLKKGVDSIEKQIKLHELKKEEARKDGKIELEDYYERDIARLEKQKKWKEELLGK